MVTLGDARSMLLAPREKMPFEEMENPLEEMGTAPLLLPMATGASDTAAVVASAVPSRWARCTKLAGDSQRYNAHPFSDGGTRCAPEPLYGEVFFRCLLKKRTTAFWIS